MLRTDNGPEFMGETFMQWAKQHGMAIQHIQPGKPNQDAFIERFNKIYREDALDQHLFLRLEDVHEATWHFLIGYNLHWSHDSLGGMTPFEYRYHHARNSTFTLFA